MADNEKQGSQDDFLEKSLRDPYVRRKLEESVRLSVLFKRNEDLREKDFYIEYLLLGSQLIEYLIKDAIKQCIKITGIHLKEGGLVKKPYLKNENITLGELIKILKFYIKDEGLIAELEEFMGYRNRAAHKLFDTSKDFKKINQELESYASKDKIYLLIIKLQKLMSLLLLEEIEIDSRNKGIKEKDVIRFRKKFLEFIETLPPRKR